MEAAEAAPYMYTPHEPGSPDMSIEWSVTALEKLPTCHVQFAAPPSNDTFVDRLTTPPSPTCGGGQVAQGYSPPSAGNARSTAAADSAQKMRKKGCELAAVEAPPTILLLGGNAGLNLS